MTRRVVVIGGGIAGLAAGFRLARTRGIEVEVLDAAPRAGGAIATSREDGFLLEQGPDCFLTVKPSAIELCRELGLEDRLIGTIEGNRKSFVARKSKLHAVPEGFYLMAPSSMASLAASRIFSVKGKARMAMEPLIPRRTDAADESLASFVRRRLGQECLDRLAQPMIAGITTADPEKLSMRAAMPQFPEMEERHGSIIKALATKALSRGTSGPRYGMFATLDGGMQMLVDALAAALGPRLRTGVRVNGLRRSGNQWAVDSTSGDLAADALVIALPATAAASLLLPHDKRLAELLAGIESASVATVHVAWKEEDLRLPAAMGFVVPAIENRFTLACSFTSRKFPGRAPAGTSLVRVFAGGATRPADASLPDGELTQRVIADLRDLLGAKGKPLFARVDRHAEAMPQYHVGHMDRVAEMEKRAAAVPGLALCGASYRGVGVPDCVKSGEVAAEIAAR
ncbi:MAG: protoporphyrinogen oxidase [Planctomycetota bacterium]